MRGTTIALVAALTLVTAAAGRFPGLPAFAAGELTGEKSTKEAGIKALLAMLDNSGLKYKWSEETSSAQISFSDIEHADTKTVFVYVPDDKGYFIKMFFTLVDKPKEHRFPPAALRAAMRLNDRLFLIRLSLDESQGDIDASIGFDREGVSPRIFKDYVMHLVVTGDDLAQDLKEFVN